ncbi:bifunctional demethylmenaquinone methyltransferase/2-methoxy-6-polyprenyl-1,4-benzoquinol methylase UbiE [Desulfurella sp.]|uniref:bifunctional demethylmenaquinone methyltransferase/2-methoxy-6-polyprenyl-1,4-benzoquinol methylase UbiE n=1 Tax=Desulfurella sp. TaxID=1962857 RepID=UPI003D1324C8
MAEIGEMFSYISKTYDLLNHILSFNIDKAWRKTAISYIDGNNVLDIATGTADVALAIHKADPTKNVIGADISIGMLNIALKKTKGINNINLICADALNLPFNDNFFDNVIISFGIRNIKNRIQALYEFKRVLKPSGKLLVLEFSKPKNPIINAAYIVYKDYCLPQIAGVFSNKTAYEYLSKTIRYFPNPVFLSDAMLQVGFKRVNIRMLSFGVACLHIAHKEG